MAILGPDKPQSRRNARLGRIFFSVEEVRNRLLLLRILARRSTEPTTPTKSRILGRMVRSKLRWKIPGLVKRIRRRSADRNPRSSKARSFGARVLSTSEQRRIGCRERSLRRQGSSKPRERRKRMTESGLWGDLRWARNREALEAAEGERPQEETRYSSTTNEVGGSAMAEDEKEEVVMVMVEERDLCGGGGGGRELPARTLGV